MKIALFVNEVVDEISEYTTTRLARAACKRGHDVWYVSVGDLDYEPDDRLSATGYRACYRKGDELKPFLERAQQSEAERIELDSFGAVWLRNEAVDDMLERPWAANAGVDFGRVLAARGVTVVNDPEVLARAGSKLYLHEFPQSVRPKGLVSRNSETITDFIADVGRCVLKPVYGAKGRSVFVIEGPDDPNLNQIIEAVCEHGYVNAQEFVSGGDEGDVRLFLLEGEILQHEGKYAAFARQSRGNDPRANISAGGKPSPLEPGKRESRVAEAIKDKLISDGMFFVGVDLVGDKVIEINAESPGGLQSAEHFTGHDFGLTICEALEKRVARSAQKRRVA